MAWDDTFAVTAGKRLRVDLGTRLLWVERAPGQWLLGDVVRDADEDRALVAEVVGAESAPESDGEAVVRVAVAGDGGEVRFVPLPPTRPLIARPELPLTVPAGETCRVYVGMPVWVRIEDRGRLLREVEAVRLSDTWFGTTLEGTLCFSTRTLLRMDLDGIPRRPYRAGLPIDVENRGHDPLVLERVRIPAPSLAIWGDAQGGLWASPVRLVRHAEGDAEVHVVDRPPPEAGEARRLGAPREVATGALSRVFAAIGFPGLGVA